MCPRHPNSSCLKDIKMSIAEALASPAFHTTHGLLLAPPLQSVEPQHARERGIAVLEGRMNMRL